MTRKSSVSNRASTLALAIALVVGPAPALAQSFQGTGSFTTNGGGAADITPGAQTTTITLNPGQTVIDWTPTDDAVAPGVAINFQPTNSTATFISTDDFAVLNRINITDTSRLISMDGTINSIVGELTGGSVFFYSPSGFVLGANAAINVGSLVLTSSQITVDGNGNFINGGTVEFGQSLSGAGIYTNAGSNISALNESSYVAMVAPRVNHSGTVEVNGSAALVGAEAATITFRPNGLFDIEVDVGTTDTGGVGINGTLTGPASGGAGDYHRIYAVTVPKNSALTLAIGGGANLGFEIAGAADVVGNAVVLSAGHDIINGDTSSGPSSVSGADADISIAETNFTSALYARANGDVFASAVDQTIAFASDVSFRARDHAKLEANGTGVVTVGGNLTMSANRSGNVDGESVTAGNVTLQAFAGGTITVGGTTSLTAIGTGGYSDTPGLATGDGTGGIIFVQATTGGDLSLGGSLYADVTGNGGSFVGDIDGGDGLGGTINLYASGDGTVSVAGGTYLTANGQAGIPIECIGCGGIGGLGDAGTVNVQAHSGSNSSIDLGDVLYIWANGYGGFGQQGGFAVGGNVSFSASDASFVTVAGDVSIEADGRGGDSFGDGINGGTGRGGFVETFASNGGVLDLSAGLSESADGTGGDSEAGDGGLGRGGTAGVRAATGGSIDLTGPTFVTANGQGGSGLNGGTGTGGIAYVSAVAGTVHAFGNVSVSANSVGGDSDAAGGTGGSGLADVESVITPVMTEASLFSSGGTLIVEGLATVAANATGGNGGVNGGDGGSAVAAGVAGVVDGGAIIHAANNDDGSSIIRLANVVVTANAQGGQGGAGQGGTNGGEGGNGGAATGGKAIVTAAAGSGDIVAGATSLSATATGGTGGSGGSGDGGDGGNGGDGGSATGGLINAGSESGNTNFAQATNNGIAEYTSISAVSTATAGDGGDGGFGTIAGIGGDGGDAFGGNSVLLVRGSEVTVGDVNLVASAFGGDGGLSPNAPDGDGGDATAGIIGVVVTNRFNLPNQRATLAAGDISGTAVATGGSGGLADGLSIALGGNEFVVRRSDATFDSVSLVTTADTFDGNSDFASSSPIEIQNGTVTIAGQFTFQTPGSISMWNDGGTFNAAQINVAADNFIHDEFLPAPLSLGTFSADSILLTTGLDLVVDGHLVSVNSVAFNAPGLIDIDNASSSSGNLTLDAVETVTTANLVAAGTVDVDGSALDLGDVTGGTVILTSNVGDVSAADILAFGALTIDSAADILFGSIDAPQVGLNAPGSIVGGNITSDSDITAVAGNDIDVGDLTAGIATVEGFIPGSVALAAGGFVNTGAIDALGSVSIDAATEIETGAIDAADFVWLLAGGNIVTGPISALGYIEMESSGGGIDTEELDSGEHIDLLAFGDIAITSATGAQYFDVESTNGGIVTGNVAMGDAVEIAAGGGDIVAGNLSAGIVNPFPEGAYHVAVVATAGSVAVDSATSLDDIYLAASTDLTAGNLDAGGRVLGLAGGDMTFEAITSGPDGRIHLGDYSMLALGGELDETFDVEAVFNSDPVQSGGSISFNGPVSTNLLLAAAGGLVTINDSMSGQFVKLTSDDIEIAETGSIDSSSVSLVSSNATQTIIGDGVPGQGYLLSNDEFGRIDAIAFGIGVDAALGANPFMLVGDLNGVGGNGNEYSFSTYEGDDEESPTGSIRVVGDVLFTGMSEFDDVSFVTRTFQLDAETGLLSLTGTGNELAGTLELDANHIHVASGEILDQLADDLQYEGYQADLNTPAAVERSDGVIRAAVINIEIGNAGEEDLYTLFVQNTGTADLPAGFVASEQILFGEDDEFFLPPGSLDLVINGQIVTPEGVLTGIEVRDALVEAQGDLTPFTENSTVNGCLLTGPCVVEPSEPTVPPDFQPAPGIQAEIVLAQENDLPPPEFGNEDFIDDNDEETEDDSPIEAPAPLFDTSEMGEEAKSTNVEVGTSMRSTPGLTAPDDVDDPISGSGNPSLMETPPVPQEEKQQ